ncbi:DUF5060 domain-containing protein [Bacteroides sp. 214]|nr:DUF5060 domain-containing protein [Bacteroides sp. 214]
MLCVSTATAQEQVEQWGRFEATLAGTPTGNPFVDADLRATFSNGEEQITVNGFYDGDKGYKIRFMPQKTGTWSYTTRSNMKSLDNQSGSFECIPATGNNHGMVGVRNTWDFGYADGTPYYPFGTTMYAFVHPNMEREEQTLKTLSESPFNKIRICVFPKTYDNNNNEPRYFPFLKIEGAVPDSLNNNVAVWDFTRFDTDFFRHLERRIDDLDRLGIQCDLILFHPYDEGHFGFDRMTRSSDLNYVRYLVARLASFRNIWWSLANEWDFLKAKTTDDWDAILKTVAESDPYGHLVSNHNGKIYTNYHHPLITHCSIQNESACEEFGRAGLVKDSYRKPVVFDEICYEGNYPNRWGSLSGEELTFRFWQAAIVGTYATHGEVFTSADHIAWTEKGAILRGTSAPRIGFLRKLIEQTGSLKIIDNWRYLNIAKAEKGQVVIYLGKEKLKEWAFMVPTRTAWANGTKVKVEVLDTWNMTTTEVKDVFVTERKQYEINDVNMRKVKLPGKPYMALVLTVVE